MGNIKYLIMMSLPLLVSCQKESDYPEPGTWGWASEQTIIQNKSVKRGACYSFQLPEEDTELLGPGISWAYNWGTSISDELITEFAKYDIEYCPMSWNASTSIDEAISTFVTNNPGCKYLLGYNEPNLTDQANMTPSEAASEWHRVKSLADNLGLKVIAPAMNYGTLPDYHDPIKWLDEFFNLIDGTDGIDGISIHCYMGSVSALKDYVEMFKKYGKPIWVTEFCSWDNDQVSASAQMTYMSEVINYLEADQDIFRYSWFIPRGIGPGNSSNNLISGSVNSSKLTDLGLVYVNMSTQDKSVFYKPGNMVPAEHYSETNAFDEDNTITVHLRPTTDDDGLLDICNFNTGKWVEYQLETPVSGNFKFQFRYESNMDADLEFYVNDKKVLESEFPRTGNEWTNFDCEIPLEAGQQNLKIKVVNGMTNINWFRFQ